jgi:hypothetical protein
VASNFPLAGWIAFTVRERSDELQHLLLALRKLILAFLIAGSHMTTINVLIISVKSSESIFGCSCDFLRLGLDYVEGLLE